MNPDAQVRLECLRMATEIVNQSPRPDEPRVGASRVLEIAQRLEQFVRTGKAPVELAPVLAA